jgi:hypothetical protein
MRQLLSHWVHLTVTHAAKWQDCQKGGHFSYSLFVANLATQYDNTVEGAFFATIVPPGC